MSKLCPSLRYIRFIILFLFTSVVFSCSLSAQPGGDVKSKGKLKFIRDPNLVTIDQKGNVVSNAPIPGAGFPRLESPQPNPSALPSQYCHPNPDCGVHALYYLLRLHRIECTQEEVAARLPLNEGTGASMLDMRDASTGFGCSTVVVHLSVSDAMTHVPFIARLKGNKTNSNDDINDGHYVVVTLMSDNNVMMIDGSGAGFINASREAFERDFSGYAIIVRKPWWNAAWITISLLSIFIAEVSIIVAYFLIKRIHSQGRNNNAQSNAREHNGELA
jgi:hypothetical protein